MTTLPCIMVFKEGQTHFFRGLLISATIESYAFHLVYSSLHIIIQMRWHLMHCPSGLN